MHAKQVILTFLAMPKTSLLIFLVHIWDHFMTDTFVTLLLKIGLRFAIAPSEMVISKLFCFWLVSHCNPHYKTLQLTCLDVFDNNWHALLYISYKNYPATGHLGCTWPPCYPDWIPQHPINKANMSANSRSIRPWEKSAASSDLIFIRHEVMLTRAY